MAEEIKPGMRGLMATKVACLFVVLLCVGSLDFDWRAVLAVTCASVYGALPSFVMQGRGER